MRWPIEHPLDRRPRRSRPADWQPRPGDRVLYYRGGGYPMITVRIVIPDSHPGKHIATWGAFLCPVSSDRIYPYPDWRETRSREERDGEPELDALRAFLEARL